MKKNSTEQLSLFEEPTLSKNQAVDRLKPYFGQDLRAVAHEILKLPRQGKLSQKGWAGLTIEALLGLRPNHKQGADFIDWELKVIPLIYQAQSQSFVFKKEMKITLFQPLEMYQVSFFESFVYDKIKSMLIVCRIAETPTDERSLLCGIFGFELSKDVEILEALQREYDDLNWLISKEGTSALSDFRGQWLQVRKDGDYWYFYATKELIAKMCQTRYI